MPALCRTEGVAGAWTFALDRHQDNRLGLRSAAADDPPGGLRVRLLYLDDEPAATAQRVRDRVAQASETAPEVGGRECVLDTTLHSIVPWQDW